jgi:hypothetical protein
MAKKPTAAKQKLTPSFLTKIWDMPYLLLTVFLIVFALVFGVWALFTVSSKLEERKFSNLRVGLQELTSYLNESDKGQSWAYSEACSEGGSPFGNGPIICSAGIEKFFGAINSQPTIDTLVRANVRALVAADTITINKDEANRHQAPKLAVVTSERASETGIYLREKKSGIKCAVNHVLSETSNTVVLRMSIDCSDSASKPFYKLLE